MKRKKIALGIFFLLLLCFSLKQVGAPPSIPKVAHFCYGLWDDGELPPFFQETLHEWKSRGWTVHLWGRKEVDELLHKYPEFEQLCSSFSRKVQKADLARCLIIYEKGGFYFDLDCRPKNRPLLNSLESRSAETSAVFFIETKISPEFSTETKQFPIRHGEPEHLERLANFAFGATPKHPLIWKILELMQFRCITCSNYNGDYDVLYKTGPDCLTECIQNARNQYSDKQLWIPDHKRYLSHHATGTWRCNQDLNLVGNTDEY